MPKNHLWNVLERDELLFDVETTLLVCRLNERISVKCYLFEVLRIKFLQHCSFKRDELVVGKYDLLDVWSFEEVFPFHLDVLKLVVCNAEPTTIALYIEHSFTAVNIDECAVFNSDFFVTQGSELNQSILLKFIGDDVWKHAVLQEVPPNIFKC